MGVNERFDELVLKKGICSQKELDEAKEIQKKYGGALWDVIVSLGYATEETMIQILGEAYGIPLYRDLPPDLKIQTVRPSGIPGEFFSQHQIYPIYEKETQIALAIKDPKKIELFSAIERLVGKKARPYLATEEEIHQIEEFFDTRGVEGRADEHTDTLKELALEAPVIKIVSNILTKALRFNASDVHFESFKTKIRVRYRIDGVLIEGESIPQRFKKAVIARLKLLTGMNIAQNRLPQDGRMSIKTATGAIDIRASSAPTADGESFVLRLLGKKEVPLSLEKMGFEPKNLNILKKLLQKPHGVILTTGPTGSGKTSTLYASLNYLNNNEKKIITVEDPVEYTLDGVTQIQVNSSIGYDFPTALRSILRQDPDIIMIGEIRDEETARIAIQSALTGHLVLSTLHTNTALGAFARLMDMGIEYYLLKSSIIGVMGQRLVRKLCDKCKKKSHIAPQILQIISPHKMKQLQEDAGACEGPYEPTGCTACNFTGYRGRLPVMEIVPTDEKLLKELDQNRSFNDISALGYRSIKEDAIIKYLKGETSAHEVMRL